MLLCLMLMWTIGFLTYGNTPNIILDYIFEIVKCLQGLLIYIDRVVLNVRIRAAVTDRCKRLKTYIVRNLIKSIIYFTSFVLHSY